MINQNLMRLVYALHTMEYSLKRMYCRTQSLSPSISRIRCILSSFCKRIYSFYIVRTLLQRINTHSLQSMEIFKIKRISLHTRNTLFQMSGHYSMAQISGMHAFLSIANTLFIHFLHHIIWHYCA